MIILPPNPDRGQRCGFVVATSLLGGLTAGVAGFIVFRWAGLLAGSSLGALATVIGLSISPRKVVWAYELWNRAASRYARVARSWIAWLCFNIVFFAVGRAGASLQLGRPAGKGSLWVARGTLDPRAYTSEFMERAPRRRTWIAGFTSWAIRTRRPWTLALLPFLLVLQALDPQEDLHLPGGLYTLY